MHSNTSRYIIGVALGSKRSDRVFQRSPFISGADEETGAYLFPLKENGEKNTSLSRNVCSLVFLFFWCRFYHRRFIINVTGLLLCTNTSTGLYIKKTIICVSMCVFGTFLCGVCMFWMAYVCVFLSEYSGFLLPSKEKHVRLIGDCKIDPGSECAWLFVLFFSVGPCDGLVTHPEYKPATRPWQLG